MNLDVWNKFSAEDQGKLQAAFDEHTENIWIYSEELFDDAMRCNVGETPCELNKPYNLVNVPFLTPMWKRCKMRLRNFRSQRGQNCATKPTPAVQPTGKILSVRDLVSKFLIQELWCGQNNWPHLQFEGR